MKKDSTKISFVKVFLTALFSGIIATLVIFVFEIWYRMATLYGPSDFINVSTIIFAVNLLLLTAGVAYFAFKSWFQQGDWLFVIFSLLITGLCIWEIAGIHRFSDLKMNREFIQLLGGVTIIVGAAVLCVPYFYNNKKISGFYYDAEF